MHGYCLYMQSAQAICKLSEVMGESLSSYHHVLLDSVMKELPGRLWEVGMLIMHFYMRNATL